MHPLHPLATPMVSIGVVGLGTDVAVATDVSAFVERLTTAASGVAAVVLVLQFAVAAHVLVAVIDFITTASVRRVLVNYGPTTVGMIVRHVADNVVRAGLTIWGLHTNVKRGPFSHTHTQYFLSRSALFFSEKLDDLF